MEVAVERDRVDLAVVRRVEVAEERPDVLPVELCVGVTRDRSGRAGSRGRRSRRATAGRRRSRRTSSFPSTRPGEPCRRSSGSRPRSTLTCPPVSLLPVRGPPLEGLRDLGPVEGQEVDADALELRARRAGRRGCARCGRVGEATLDAARSARRQSMRPRRRGDNRCGRARRGDDRRGRGRRGTAGCRAGWSRAGRRRWRRTGRRTAGRQDENRDDRCRDQAMPRHCVEPSS